MEDRFQVFEISTVGDADTSDLALVIIATEIDMLLNRNRYYKY